MGKAFQTYQDLTPEERAEIQEKQQAIAEKYRKENNLDEHGEPIDKVPRPSGGVERERERGGEDPRWYAYDIDKPQPLKNPEQAKSDSPKLEPELTKTQDSVQEKSNRSTEQDKIPQQDKNDLDRYSHIDPENGNVIWDGPLNSQKGDHSGMPPRTDAYPDGFDRGHVNASSTGGSNTNKNIVPQHSDVNRSGGGYYAMEKGERTTLQNGSTIDSTKVAVMNNGSVPEVFMATDKVTYPDGHTETIHHSFANDSYKNQQEWNDSSSELLDTVDDKNPGDELRNSMSPAEYADLMERTDAEIPGIVDDYASTQTLEQEETNSKELAFGDAEDNDVNETETTGFGDFDDSADSEDTGVSDADENAFGDAEDDDVDETETTGFGDFDDSTDSEDTGVSDVDENAFGDAEDNDVDETETTGFGDFDDSTDSEDTGVSDADENTFGDVEDNDIDSNIDSHDDDGNIM